ncbi:hypothetical protein PFLUV_G00262370 [Perca fluviatilis]|uniref:Uncharacterized protein n=1 Tax=Perca fluviatilis TaxID=8168 RepID=A0A6A5DMJ0_PERFL|nr:hypothetical protein PFLUV_G00262370 [Perca fluviatilis]
MPSLLPPVCQEKCSDGEQRLSANTKLHLSFTGRLKRQGWKTANLPLCQTSLSSGGKEAVDVCCGGGKVVDSDTEAVSQNLSNLIS